MKLKKIGAVLLSACMTAALFGSVSVNADNSEAFSEIESSLGDLSCVSGKINMEKTADGKDVKWEISDTSVIDYDGNVAPLPTYADGPMTTVIKAEIDGEERSYTVRTATQPVPVIEVWNAEDGNVGDVMTLHRNAVITDSEARSGEKSYLAPVDEKAAWGWQYFFTHVFQKPSFVTDTTKYIVSMYVKEPKGASVTKNYANNIMVGGNPYSSSVKQPPLSDSEWSHWTAVSVGRLNNVQPGFNGGAPKEVLVDDYEISLLAVGGINITGGDNIKIPLYGNSANTLNLGYEIFNQYGTSLGMVRWNTDPARSWDSQTASWSIVNPQSGVSIDENGILSVDGNAHRGSVTVRATVDKSDLPGSGWIYAEKTVNIGSDLDSEPVLRNVSLTGEVSEGNVLTASYQYYHIDNIELDTVDIRWLKADRDEKSLYTPIAGANESTYTVTADDMGKCIKAELTPKDKNGTVGKVYYTNVVASKTAPEAHNVKISLMGKIAVGEKLLGTYTYYDVNNDPAGEHTFRWLRADGENEEPAPIDGAVSAEYTLTDIDLGKYLYFEVTPVSQEEPYIGKTVRSKGMRIPTAEVSINITDLCVDGILAADEKVSAFYNYENFSGVKEGKSVCKWYVSDTQNGSYEMFETKYVTAEEPSEITIPSEYTGKYIMFEIVPFDTDGNYGINVSSDPVQIGNDTEALKSALSYIEEQMGHMNAIDDKSVFVKNTPEASVTWKSFSPDVITSDGDVSLKEYSEGAREAVMLAEINISGNKYYKAYRLKTATLGLYIFSKYDAENASVGTAPTGLGRSVVTDVTAHSGTQAYVVTPQQSGNPRQGFSLNLNTNDVSPSYDITDDTRFILNSYLKRSEGSTASATPTLFIGPSAPENKSYAYTPNLKWNSESWTQFQAMAFPKYSYQIQNYFYSAFSDDFYLDDLEISVLSVGSIDVSGDDSLAIPLLGEDASSASYSYEMLNQYGTTMGMTEWTWTRNEKTFSCPGQTASWKLARDYDGVTLSEDGVLSVNSDAHAGEIKIRAYANPSELPGSNWVYGEKTVTLKAKTAPVPEARNINAEGVVELGNTLKGSYDFYQSENAYEGNSEIRWLRANKNESGSFEPIENANSFEYTVTEADIGKFLVFEVTPADYKGNKGETVRSNVLAGKTAPEAHDVKITYSGQISVGTELMGTYTFYDINTSDYEDGTAYRWLRADTEGGIYKEITGETGTKYTLTTADIDKYIKFEVTPSSNSEPKIGEAVKSEAFAAAFKPKAENVKITGTLKAGNTVTGSYTYSHIHSYPENGSTYEWYVDGKKVGDSITYKITSSDAGKNIVFTVTPRTTTEPSEGNAVSSQSHRIASLTSGNTGFSGGGSGGGGGWSSSNNNSGNTDIKNPDTSSPSEAQSSYFNDTKNHWAFSDIEEMAKLGIAKGVAEKTFNPDGIITRAEFVTLVLRALELPETAYSGGFSDVNENDWFAPYVETAAKYKIISDTADKFYPNTPVTRQEMAKIIAEAYKTDGNELDMSKTPAFSDADDINAWAKGYVSAAFELGLIKGVGDNRFEPQRTATRAEAIVIIKRLYNLMY